MQDSLHVFDSEVQVCRLPCYTLLLLRFRKLPQATMRRYTFQPSMSDTRQAKQSSHPADISHLGSKFQENKPLENMAHQTFLHREVKQQVSRPSNQENKHQETKHTFPLPVLNPKYPSIQPTSDPASPPDQFFKPQEATCAPFHPTYVFSHTHTAHNYLSSAKS